MTDAVPMSAVVRRAADWMDTAESRLRTLTEEVERLTRERDDARAQCECIMTNEDASAALTPSQPKEGAETP